MNDEPYGRDPAPSVKLSSGQEIHFCKQRLHHFVHFDAYEVYDYWGGWRQQPAHEITESHVEAMNAAMLARSSRKAWRQVWRGFAANDLMEELAPITLNLDLIDGPQDDVNKGNQALSGIVRNITQQRGLTDMAASKALHLLRPRFVAISDSYVREALGISAGPGGDTLTKEDTCAQRMVRVQEKMRALGQENAETLNALFQFANSAILPFPARNYRCRKAGIKAVPVKLTKLRILDILLWTEGALKSHPAWKSWDEQTHQP